MPVRIKGSARPKSIRSPDPLDSPTVNRVPALRARVEELKANPEGPQQRIYAISSTAIWKAESMPELWAGNYLEILPASPINWDNRYQYFTHQGKAYAVGNTSFWEGNSIEEVIIDGNYTRSNVVSPLSWNDTHKYVSDGTYIYASAGNGWWRASTVDDLWQGTGDYTFLRNSAVGWNSSLDYIGGVTGPYYGVAASLVSYTSMDNLIDGTDPTNLGISPVSWNNSVAYAHDDNPRL